MSAEHLLRRPRDQDRGFHTDLADHRADGVRHVGIGGDRLCLYSHPAEIAVEFREGGWDAEAIAAVWGERFAAHSQPFGVQMPKVDLS